VDIPDLLFLLIDIHPGLSICLDPGREDVIPILFTLLNDAET
jgi:hypothetical protein